ncbi:MAG: hypothetical protein ABIF40_04280 [archaeon]
MQSNLVQSLKNYEDNIINSAYHEVKKTKIKTLPFSFQGNKARFYDSATESSIELIEKYLWELQPLPEQRPKMLNLLQLFEELKIEQNKKSLKNRLILVAEMKKIAENIKEIKKESFHIKIPKLPSEVKDEVLADLTELKKCFESGCYRSAVILCGRILEIALHRKYYDATGLDILEKNPGIGLGTLIAKLADKNVKLDPGLSQQIHLINQARIFSVHKKQRAFYPSGTQTQAMILYTIDILEKMF